MRRRVKAGTPPEELTSFPAWAAALGVFVEKDLTPLKLPTVADYRVATANRYECWRQWRAARARFAEVHRWPGGEDARWAQEMRVAPGAPFHPAADL